MPHCTVKILILFYHYLKTPVENSTILTRTGPSVALVLIHFSRGVPLQFFSKKNYTILVVIQWCRRSEHQQ
jgi:hypothetical protein